MALPSPTRFAPAFAAALGLLLPLGDAAAGGPGKGKASSSKASPSKAAGPRVSRPNKGGTKVTKTAHEKAPLRVVTMKVAKVKRVDGLEPVDDGPNPWADMPAVAVPSPVGVTADSFPLSPYQPYTTHGYTAVSGYQRNGPDKYEFRIPGTGSFGVQIQPSFWAGHDVTLDCWGKFSGPVQISARGRASNNTYSEFSAVTMSPPAGNQGRIKIAVPAKSFALHGDAALGVRIRTVDSKSRGMTIYQCVVERS